MGQEIACALRQEGRVSQGTALLENDEIISEKTTIAAR